MGGQPHTITLGNMSPKISVAHAIRAGLFWVNGPVLFMLFGPLFAVTRLMPQPGYWGLGAFVGGFVAAWLWWSITVPRWRLWAYERVHDLDALRRSAVEVGLTWPGGHIFERTEIKSKAMRAKQMALEETPSKLMKATREMCAPDDER